MATQPQVAKHLDLSTRRVRGLVSEGILPPSKGPGAYDLDAMRVAYIRYLRGVQTGQVTKKEPELEDDDYRKGLEREKYREKKRENDVAENLLAPVSVITSIIADLGGEIVPLLESLPVNMKRENPNLKARDIELAKKTIAKCQNAISDIRLDKISG